MQQQSSREFISKESIGGLMLIAATIVALIISNTPLKSAYQHLLGMRFSVMIESHGLSKPLLLWINDGLMTIFFFVIGLELKRECLTGHLREVKNVILPVMAAIGGVVLPIIIFLLLNFYQPQYHKGWAIPMATDIAFALGIMSLYSHRVSKEMKIFLLTLAIIDDLIAIVVIGIFHSHSLSWYSLLIAGICVCLLLIINRAGVKRLTPYFLIGLILWVSVLKSGVHATLSGVILAFFIPLEGKKKEPILKNLEDDLHPVVAFIVLPVFAFANAGIEFYRFSWNSFYHSIPLGIMFGLLIGKPLGVLSFTYITQKITRVKMLTSWLDIAIIGSFAGIGFTMSLFIASLAFGENAYVLDLCRLGILLGSILSIVLASFLIAFHKRDVIPDTKT
jgi:NhaA family Na+:H+ antiporter